MALGEPFGVWLPLPLPLLLEREGLREPLPFPFDGLDDRELELLERGFPRPLPSRGVRGRPLDLPFGDSDLAFCLPRLLLLLFPRPLAWDGRGVEFLRGGGFPFCFLTVPNFSGSCSYGHASPRGQFPLAHLRQAPCLTLLV